MSEDSVFTKIINRELPADIKYEDDEFIVVTNIEPVAPVHLLVIAKEPYRNIQDVDPQDHHFHAKLLELGREVAEQNGIGDNFQLHLNCGPQVQRVLHLHMHVLGGWKKSLTAEDIDEINSHPQSKKQKSK